MRYFELSFMSNELIIYPDQVKQKTLKIGIHSFLAWPLALKEQCEASIVCGWRVEKLLLDLIIEKFLRSLLVKAT